MIPQQRQRQGGGQLRDQARNPNPVYLPQNRSEALKTTAASVILKKNRKGTQRKQQIGKLLEERRNGIGMLVFEFFD